ncbi:MAG: LysM peptidoglycan-binding domain-containing protein [Phycisphaerae bacterium]
MRWNAVCLVTSCPFILFVVGCGLFGKKEPQTYSAEPTGDQYAAPTYETPAKEPLPYTEEPAAVEPSYPVMAETPSEPASPRYHVVAKKDTLYRLARLYYDDASRWKDIYEANRGTIKNPDKIFIGQRLLIP